MKITGKNASSLKYSEPGGHRWQEYSGPKVHTSTITVAVFDEHEFKKQNFKIDDKDLKWEFTRGSGKGGQHRNKTDSCVRLTHIPTGISVRIDGRSQPQNKIEAYEILTERLKELQKSQAFDAIDKNRKVQIGTGQTGEKVRTIRVRDDQVFNHSNDTKISYKKYQSGDWDKLI